MCSADRRSRHPGCSGAITEAAQEIIDADRAIGHRQASPADIVIGEVINVSSRPGAAGPPFDIEPAGDLRNVRAA